MTIQPQKAAGFGVVSVLVLAAVIVLLGIAGWRVWENQSKVSEDDNITKSVEESYLKIKELGIKIKLSDEIKDATYIYSVSSDGSQNALISTTTLTNKSNGDCGPKTGPLGAVVKTQKDTDEIFNIKREVDNKRVFKFDDSYIFMNFPNSPCTLNDEILKFSLEQRSAFVKAFETVEPDSSR